MLNYKLNQYQINFFHTFGYILLKGLFLEDIDQIEKSFSEIFRKKFKKQKIDFDKVERICVPQFIDLNENLANLLDDERVLNIGESILGSDFNYMGSDGNYYNSNTSWHSDGWQCKILHIKLAFYLDNLKQDRGCLKVLPGSHYIKDEYSNYLNKSLTKSCSFFKKNEQHIPGISIETKPGDLICFNHNLKHCSYGGSKKRRMFTINLSQRYPKENLRDLKDYINQGSRFWIDKAYGEIMLKSASKKRMKHLEQVLENDEELKYHSNLARKNMKMPANG
tara:strand:+ start:1916 stop:2752 length:837 start_codon:yes stop_codon:yes gene_type:complete